MTNQFLEIERTHTIKDLLEIIANSLRGADIENPNLEARLILSHYMTKPLEDLILNLNNKIIYTEELNNLIKQRILKVPLAYIIGYKEFYGRNFFVNRNVLIPRPDTETLIDAILKKYKNNPNLNILELGVGSGCIIITLVLELGCKGLGIDISQDALDVAIHNAKLSNSLNNLIFLQSNWFQNISLKSKFDIIVSNPPYINQSEIGMMSEETLLYEPELALYTDSYKSYKEIALLAKNYLKENGVVYVEIGFGQEQDIIDIFLEQNYKKLDHFYDITNVVRVLSFSNYSKLS